MSAKARVWTCVECGKRAAWGKGWCYPAGLVEDVCCSETCLNRRIDSYGRAPQTWRTT